MLILRTKLEGGMVSEEADTEADTMLNKCTNIEYCEQCAYVCCYFMEPLHFHHDGCPACDMMSEEDWGASKLSRDTARLLRLTK